ncbi:class I tRNA ligase family protein, partial [Candidatus Poribacteria bacterium]|nr:class I tRNA ligase family protein [Candidatus Poribacteria bacterium]
MKPKFYITTAIPYVNALPHLGHSYEMVVTDVIARYKRLAGYDVWFLTGLDENSQNCERKARELGKDPQEYVDEMAAAISSTWQALG